MAERDERPVVLVPEPIGAAGIAMLEAECEVLAPWRETGAADFGECRLWLPRADALIVRLFAVGESEMASAPRLRVIAKAGVGLDNIDCGAAETRGIAVLWAPGANSNAVAEHAIGLLIAVSRGFLGAHGALSSGSAFTREQFLGPELLGKTLGVVGFGRVGSRVARKASAGLGMKVLAYDPYVDSDVFDGVAIRAESLDELLSESDFITLHVPLTAETRHLLDAERLSRVRPSCRVVNTSRGAVIDEKALVRALEESELAAAALDVFEAEPLDPAHPLCSTPNVLLTPHIAGMTPEAFENSARMVAEDVLGVLEGRAPRYPAPEV